MPSHPARLPRPSGKADHQGSSDEPNTGATTSDPSALGKEVVPDRGAHELSAEHAHHIRGVDSIPCFRRNSVDRTPVRDLAGLETEIDGKRLDDGSGDRERAGIRSDGYPRDADELAENDGKERHELVDDEAGIWWAEAHGAHTDQGEETDDEVVVIVRRFRKKKG